MERIGNTTEPLTFRTTAFPCGIGGDNYVAAIVAEIVSIGRFDEHTKCTLGHAIRAPKNAFLKPRHTPRAFCTLIQPRTATQEPECAMALVTLV